MGFAHIFGILICLDLNKRMNKSIIVKSLGTGKKGFVKKSIFKTPENSSGRVGVGTCGVGGQKMTDFKMTGNKFRRN